MIIDQKNKQMQMEPRDLHYILPAYIRSYLFYTKNEMPERIVFPMLSSVPFGNQSVPIEWAPEISPVVVEIVKEGSNVAEVTAEQEAVLDEKDDTIKELRSKIADLEGRVKPNISEETEPPNPKKSKAKAAFSAPVDRKPKLPPGGDIGPGLPLSDIHKRDARDLSRTKKDLVEGPEIDEAAEKPFEKVVKRDEKGEPVVEE